MLCPKCGFENSSDAKYCQKCANVFSSQQNTNYNSNSNIQTMPREHQVEQRSSESLHYQNLDANITSFPSFRSLLKSTFSLIKKGFWRYVLINFLGTVIIPLIILLISYLAVKFLDTPWLLVVFLFLMYYFFFWKYSVIVNFTERLDNNENKIPFKKGFSFALGLWVFGIVFGFILNIGFFLLIIPGIYWGIKYFLTPYTYCLEEKRIFRAFGLTSDYTKGFVFALLSRVLFFVAIFILGIIILGAIMMFALPFAGLSIVGVISKLTPESVNALVTFLPLVLIFVFIYFAIFTLIEIFGFVYFYNIFNSLRIIKKKAWQENRQVTDGYTFKKKILIFLPVILIIVLMVVTVVQGFKQTKNIDTNLLINQQKNEINLEDSNFDDFKNENLEDKFLEEEQFEKQEQKIYYNLDTATGRDEKRIADIKQIQIAFETYYLDNNKYPPHDSLSMNLFKPFWTFNCLDSVDGVLKYEYCENPILNSFPKNPSPGGEQYAYELRGNGLYYIITFALENGLDNYGQGKYYATPNGIFYQGEYESSVDYDNDRLNDYKEINIWFTNPNNPDTDGDGYLDGDEVENGYDPLGPGKL